MRHRMRFTLALATLLAAGMAGARGALPPRAAVLADGARAAQHWLAASGSNLSCRWTDATFMAGISALQAATGDARLLRRMVEYGDSHGWRFCMGRLHDPDYQACGAAYAAAYLASPPPRNASWLAAIEAVLDEEMRSMAVKMRDWWSWVDALWMGMNVRRRARVWGARGGPG